MERGIRRVLPECEVEKAVVADGGEGTMPAIVNALRGDILTASVRDPLGRPIRADYGLVEDGDTPCAIIEMAAASGLTLLREEERNPMAASSAGTGDLIADALARGSRRLLIGIGGSATNDGGMGMLGALGFVFRDKDGNALPGCGASMARVCSIDEAVVPQAVRDAEFVVACDVDTPFCGPQGAAFTFAPQKGASAADVERLDAGMHAFAQTIWRHFHVDILSIRGGGAAGGLGGAFRVFLGARLVRGIDMVLDATSFEKKLKDACLVITGEGRIDSQTPRGKTAAGVLARCKRRGIPVIAIGGQVEPCDELLAMGFRDILPINDPSTPLHLAMQKDFAMKRIEQTIAGYLKNLLTS